MAKVAATIEIDRSADDVWSVMGRFSDMSWYHGVETCRVNGDIRTLTVRGMDVEIDEKLLHRDEAARAYSFAVVAHRGDFPVIRLPDGRVFDPSSSAGHHRATLSVEALGPSKSRATYEVELDSGHDALINETERRWLQVLEHLKLQLES